MSRVDLLQFASSTEAPTFRIGASAHQIVHGSLVRRGPVTSEAGSVEDPRPIVRESETIEAWHRLEKRRLLVECTGATTSGPDGSKEIAEFLRRCAAALPIRCDGPDLSRFGNFEILTASTGDYSTESPFVTDRLIRVGDAWRSTIRLTGPSKRARLTARIRLRAISSSDFGGAILHDALHDLSPGDFVQIDCPECPASVEATLYDADGNFVASRLSTTILGFGLSTSQVSGPTAALPSALRGEIAQRVGATPSIGLDAPWIVAETEGRALRAEIFPTDDPDYHVFSNPDQHRAFVAEYLTKGSRLVVADPYFDVGVLREYFIRKPRLRVDLTIVVSRDRSDPSLATLEWACRFFAQDLPDDFKILNITEKDGDRGAFHDRFAIVETPTRLDAWHLGASLNSYSRKYPLFAIRARGAAKASWIGYVDELIAGHTIGNRGLLVTKVFEKTGITSYVLTQPRVLAANIRRIPFWATILDTLAPSRMRRPWDRILSKRTRVRIRLKRAAAVLEGLLEKHFLRADGYEQSWTIDRAPPVKALRRFVVRMRRDDRALDAMAMWAARGGPKASDYAFDRSDVSRLVARLEQDVRRPPRRGPPGRTFSNIEAVIAHYENGANAFPTLERFRNKWLPTFVRDAALGRDPCQFLDFLSRFRSQRAIDVAFAFRNDSGEVVTRALLHRDPVVVGAVLVLLKQQGFFASRFPRREEMSLDAFDFAAARALLDESDKSDFASSFDDVVVTQDQLARLRLIAKEAGVGVVDGFSSLAERRSGIEADILRSAIIDDFASDLPLRNQWSAEAMRQGYHDDVELPPRIAAALSKLSSGQDRYLEIARSLDRGACNAPFLRIRDWQLWDGLWRRIVLFICVGLELARREASVLATSIYPTIAGLLRALQPEVLRKLHPSSMLMLTLELAGAASDAEIREALATFSAADEAQKRAMNVVAD